VWIVLKRAEEILDQMIAWRRDFHQHPELAFQETRTAGVIASVLKDLGYKVRRGVGGTGVVGDLGSGKPVVAIRADMDALPIQEANEVPYASAIPGVMHACGHDGHIAMALGAATLLRDIELPGTVRFIFQPAEEATDEEGISGAPRMIQDGALKGADAVLALHLSSVVETGRVEAIKGISAAGVDTFYTTIIGKGGHGAAPHRVVDPIFVSGYVILAIHGIISRRLKPIDSAVISIGSIHSGTADNIIPEKVEMSGTIRFMSQRVQKKIHKELNQALGVSRALGADFENKIEIGYPPMVNHPNVVDLLEEVYNELMGTEIGWDVEPEMGAEDFGFFTQKVPGAMFTLGCRIEGDERRHHDPRFDIDERAMPVGVAMFFETTLRIMQENLHESWKAKLKILQA
jgi:amidohydrolase